MSQADELMGWRVQDVKRDPDSGELVVRLTPIYYGKDEDGPEVGQALIPREQAAK